MSKYPGPDDVCQLPLSLNEETLFNVMQRLGFSNLEVKRVPTGVLKGVPWGFPCKMSLCASPCHLIHWKPKNAAVLTWDWNYFRSPSFKARNVLALKKKDILWWLDLPSCHIAEIAFFRVAFIKKQKAWHLKVYQTYFKFVICLSLYLCDSTGAANLVLLFLVLCLQQKRSVFAPC